MRLTILGLVLGLLLAACGVRSADTSGVADLPATTGDDFAAMLAQSERPTVVNVWASWCIPCRSEASLLVTAHGTYADRVDFIGVDVQDNQSDAKSFIVEFGLDYPNYFDSGRTVPNRFGGIGTPITFFFLPGGTLQSTHNGVIDERALALGIDELLKSGG